MSRADPPRPFLDELYGLDGFAAELVDQLANTARAALNPPASTEGDK